MEYNTSKNKLIIPEYGRHVQHMVEYACTIEDREQRNKVSKAIIAVMGQVNPHLRDMEEFTHKLWDHLFLISDYKIDVDSPYPIPARETFETKPDRVKYPNHKIKFKHYGKIVEAFVEKAISLEEGEEKISFTENVANIMKKSYINWNKDVVSDEIILDHLDFLSDGQLKVKENTRLAFVSFTGNTFKSNNPKNKKKSTNNNGKPHHRKY